VNASTYICQHPEFGWIAFSGNITQEGEWIRTEITTAGKNRLFIAPLALGLEAVSGKINQVDINPDCGLIVLQLEGKTLLDLSFPDDQMIDLPVGIVKNERGYFEITPEKGETTSIAFKIRRK